MRAEGTGLATPATGRGPKSGGSGYGGNRSLATHSVVGELADSQTMRKPTLNTFW